MTDLRLRAERVCLALREQGIEGVHVGIDEDDEVVGLVHESLESKAAYDVAMAEMLASFLSVKPVGMAGGEVH